MRSRKPLWLLALLTLRHGRPVEREWLAATLWPDLDQSRAFANLRPVLSELRSALAAQGKRLQTPDRHTLLLDLVGAEVDLLRFDDAIKSGKPSALQHAVALYRGPLLEGCHEEWVVQEREAREQVYLQALQKLGDAAVAGGDYDAAAGYYQQAVRVDPWREAARRGWMEALSSNGDINAALQVYREFVAFLKDDPKAAPDKQTSALYERLRAEVRQKVGTHAAVTAQVIAAPVVAAPTLKGYLPHPLTELVGREDECMEVGHCLRRSRLVTLTGIGGIGKTRLAREVAHEVVREYADGVWLVALEALSEGRLVIQQIASVLGLREEQGRTPLQSVTHHLRHQRVLLVLDNCEHLLQASAQVAAHLLAECGQVRILATSREALGITGEAVWSVPVLAVPDMEGLPPGPTTLVRVLMGYESVQLFVQRAQSVQKGFALSGGNARLVAQACQQLEGIPLAIELAAARVRAMSVEQIASRLNDYLGLLTSGNRAGQSRQQTLRATLDWSYALLSEGERSLLSRLSVFVGGWVLEAAERVCSGEGVAEGQVLDLLSSLVDKSLVTFEEGAAAEGRYRLLEMVRQYAASSLQGSGEAEQVKLRHRDWFLAFAETADPQLKGADQTLWRRLEAEHDNLRAALSWSEGEAQGAASGLRLAGALYRFWQVRGEFNEGRAYLGRALEREGAQGATLARSKALNGAGDLAYCQGDYASARALNEEGLTIQHALGDKGGIAISLNNLGSVDLVQGDYASARTQFEESLTMSRELGDRGCIAISLNGLGNAAYSQHDFDTARTLFEQALAILRELGDRRGIATSLEGLATLTTSRGDYDAARTLTEQGLAILRELGDRQGIATSLHNLGILASNQGDNHAARTLIEQGLAIRRELGDRRGIAYSLYSLGYITYSQCDFDTARTLFEESLVVYREMGHSYLIHALGALGHVEREKGNYARAGALYQESLMLRMKMGDVLNVVQSLEDFAGLAGRQGQSVRAVRLLGASEALCAPHRRTLPVNASQDKRTVAAAWAALDAAAFAAAWEEGRAMTLEQAVAYAMEPASVSPTH
jgi:predicted ATPase/DNA-binding SARP family transcriptional activator